ncbi:MAG: hypothetical protein KDK70_42500, partial [Myxococcales bacterium]|nr:hypothetical protein [Myxococcales bacterium]
GGGGGAGGCGGSAVGIASVGGSSVVVVDTGFEAGTSGTSGTGGGGGHRADAGVGQLAPSGADGCAGLVSDEIVYPR